MRKAILLISVILCLIVTFSLANSYEWLPDKNLTNDGKSSNLAMAVGPDDTIHVVFARDMEVPPSGTDYEESIYHMKSTDGGVTWSSPNLVCLSKNAFAASAMVPSIAVDSNGKLHVAWHGADPNAVPNPDPSYGNRPLQSVTQLMYASSTDNGDTWTVHSPLQVRYWNKDGTNTHPRIRADISSSSPYKNNLYIVWSNDGGYHLAFTRSTDGGATWATDTWIGAANIGRMPDIAIGPDGTIHTVVIDGGTAATNQGDVYYAYSTDGGVTWSASVKIYDAITNVWNNHLVTIEVNSAGTIQVVTRDNFDASGWGSLYYLEKPAASGWSSPVVIVSGKTRYSQGGWKDEMILDPSDNLYLVASLYTDTTAGRDIYMKKYDKATSTWQAEERLTTAPGTQGNPQVGIDSSGNLHVAYLDYVWLDIHYMKTGNQGPITSNVVANPNPVAVNTSVTLTANVDDSTTGGSSIASAEYGYMVATGPQSLSWAGPGAKAFEFFLQPGSSWKGDIKGIVAGPNYSMIIEGINVTGVTGPDGYYIYFNLQDAESGSTFKHLGINVYPGPLSGMGGGSLFQAYQQWTWEGISSHGLNPAELTKDNFDLRFDFSKASSGDGWTVTPYFRLSGGSWTLFYDGPFTSTASFDFLGAKLVVAFDGSANGSLSFRNYSLSSWYPMDAQDGLFDEVSEAVTETFTAPDIPGIYNVCVRGTDSANNVGPEECIMLVVYDPSAGFVTGGGWITSPEGAYVANPALTGKASFGFVSKYQKGATVPTGSTEFQFKVANLNFHSSSYDWLLVTGSNYAKFKGIGTINGEGEFKFMLWARDGAPDTFRIKIWYEENGAEIVVYDNGMDQAIGGGSIVVHTKK